MKTSRLFLYPFTATLVAMLTYFFVTHVPPYRGHLQSLGNRMFLSPQLTPDDLPQLRQSRVRTIIDFRPDGEEPGQTPAEEMKARARELNLKFYYLPIPHETIPDEAADQLATILNEDLGKTVLYCRSGRRAARTYALARASSADGVTRDDILQTVRTAGFSADDLKGRIDKRIDQHIEQSNAQRQSRLKLASPTPAPATEAPAPTIPLKTP